MTTSLNPSLTSLRKGGNTRRVYLGTWTPDIVFESTVLYGISDKVKFIPVDTGTGDIADCLPGFTVRVFSSSGAIKGATNVRAYGTPTAGILPIREMGGKDIDFFTGDIVRVYNMPFLGDKLPEDTADFNPDGLPYGTQGSDYRPNTVSGGHYIGFTDVGEDFATVPMWGAGSDVLDPTSTPGNGTHLWTLLTATLAFQAGSTSSDADPVIEADVGYGIALHTYTDNNNGTSWSQYICFQVYARDGSIPGFPLISATLNGEELAGWSLNAEVMGAVPRSALPDGNMCGLWVDETIAGLHQSVGGTYVGREHIKFIGFLAGDENTVSYRRQRTRFTLQSPLARYASLPGWSKVLTRTASPVDWTGMAGLTVKLAILHLVKYYSFVTELFDFAVNDNFLDQDFSQFFLNKMTADAQIRELADGQDARLVNLRTGELLLHTHPAYYPIGDRSSAFKLVTLTDADVLDNGTFSREHWKTLEQFELRAFKAGAVNEQYFFSRYPGATPGRGNQSHIVEKVIATDQVDANERCGRRAAKLNGAYGEYQTLVGVYEQGVEWTPQLHGSYDGLDFHFGYLQTTIAADSNGRGINLSAHLFYLSRVSVTYNANGTANVNPTLMTATNGGWGITHIPPVFVLPPYTPPGDIPPPWFPPLMPPGAIGSGTNRMAAVCVNNVFLTTDFQTPASSGGPTYASAYSKPWGGTLLQWVPNGFDPGSGWIITSTEVGYLALATGTYTVKHTFAASSSIRGADASFAESGFIVVNSYYTGVGFKRLYSLNNVDFTESATYGSTGALPGAAAVYVSSKQAGRVITSAITAAFESTNHGVTASSISPAFDTSAGGYTPIHAPYNSNPSDNIFYYGLATAADAQFLIRQVGGTITDVSPMISSNKYAPIVARNGIDSSVLNRQRMVVVGERDVGTFVDVAAFLSNDGGGTWALIEQDTSLRRCALSGDSINTGWLWGVGILEQFGVVGSVVTPDDRMGNLASLTPGEIIAIAGY